MFGREEILRRFGSTAKSPDETVLYHAALREQFVATALNMDEMLMAGREKSLAFTALEEASMWAHKALANPPKINEV